MSLTGQERPLGGRAAISAPAPPCNGSWSRFTTRNIVTPWNAMDSRPLFYDVNAIFTAAIVVAALSAFIT